MKNFVSCNHEANNLVPLGEPKSQRTRFSGLPQESMMLEIALIAQHAWKRSRALEDPQLQWYSPSCLNLSWYSIKSP